LLGRVVWVTAGNSLGQGRWRHGEKGCKNVARCFGSVLVPARAGRRARGIRAAPAAVAAGRLLALSALRIARRSAHLHGAEQRAGDEGEQAIAWPLCKWRAGAVERSAMHRLFRERAGVCASLNHAARILRTEHADCRARNGGMPL